MPSFTCRCEDEREQRVMTRGAQKQENPSILSALHRQDTEDTKETNGSNQSRRTRLAL